uniref:Uncharacterized protein n=1 Tax=Anopheles darlingi TaxID=43151 RepID=A0A2M4D4D8_ANODA
MLPFLLLVFFVFFFCFRVSWSLFVFWCCTHIPFLSLTISSSTSHGLCVCGRLRLVCVSFGCVCVLVLFGCG